MFENVYLLLHLRIELAKSLLHIRRVLFNVRIGLCTLDLYTFC